MKLPTPIEFLKDMQDKIRQDDFETGDEAQAQNYLSEVVAQAISALEKQIPKEPIIKTNAYNRIFYECPNCRLDINDVIYSPYKYCRKCGQKLKWRETNDEEEL